MVHEETESRLADAGGGVEEAHQEAQLDVGDAEVGAQEREERRQRQLEEVADEVGPAH